MTLSMAVERAATQSGSECARDGADHRLLLWGRLPRRWTAHLALHCCALGIDIRAGQVVELEEGRWAATFLLRANGDVTGYDHLAMARRKPLAIDLLLPSTARAVCIRPARTCPGTFFAWARGKNQFGFLASVLHQFDTSDLYAKRMVLRTRGEETADWFWLVPHDRHHPAGPARPETRNPPATP